MRNTGRFETAEEMVSPTLGANEYKVNMYDTAMHPYSGPIGVYASRDKALVVARRVLRERKQALKAA